MGACRECFNIFNKYGFLAFIRAIKYKCIPWGYVWSDTIQYPVGGLICKLFGHSKKVFRTDDHEEICCRCWKRIWPKNI